MAEATPAQPTPTPTPTPRPIPTPTVLAIAQAGKVYLAAVGPRNVTAAKFDKDYRAGASVKTLRADAVKALKAERHFLEVLGNTAWPEKIAGNVADLAICGAEDVSWFAGSTTITSANGLTPAPQCGGSDAQLIS